MFGNLLAKILAGAAVGYITNYLAIKMLFQEYLKFAFGKFKFSLGGLIVKERKAFEESISRLIESDVIHHEALRQEVRKEEFDKALHASITELFEQQLPQAFHQSFKVSEIPAIDNSFEQIKSLLVAQLKEPVQKVLKPLLGVVQAKQIVSDNQVLFVSKQLIQIISEFVRNDVAVSKVLESVLKNLQTQNVQAFVSENFKSQLIGNLKNIFDDLHLQFKFNHTNQIDEILSQLHEDLKIDDLLAALANQIADKQLFELFTDENVAHLPQEILRNIQKLFHSEVSEDIVETLLKFLFGVLKEEESTVFDLLSQDLKDYLKHFLANKLPDLIQSIIPWIRKRKAKLELLITETFKENTSAIGQLIATIFVGNVGNYVGIEEKIIELIEKQDAEKLATRASDYLLDYLKSNTIGQIIQSLPQANILASLTPILTENIAESIQNIKSDTFQNLFDKPIKTWFSKENIEKGLKDLYENILENNLKSQFLFDEKFSHFINKNLEKQAQTLFDSKLSDWLKTENLHTYSQSLQSNLAQFIENNNSQVQEFLQTTIQNFFKDKSVLHLIENAGNQDATQIIIEALESLLVNQFEKIKDEPLANYLDKLADIDGLERQLTDALKKYLLENMSQLIEGRVKNLVQNSLAVLPDSQLRGMVYKAMGEELEPLSLFGALLGAITGAGLIFMPEFKSIWMLMFVSGIVYGITGWGTNWLAIKMLFKPYNPVYIFGKIRLPFTPGVIAKHKGRFAKSMGRFIGERLLNSEGLKENFAKNKENLEKRLLEELQKDNFALLKNALTNNNAKFANQTTESLLAFLSNQESGLSKQISNWLATHQDWKLGNLNLDGIKKQVLELLNQNDLPDYLKKVSNDYLQKFASEEKALKDILPASWQESMYAALQKWLIAQIKKLEQRLEQADFLDNINFDGLEKRVENILDNNLLQILNDEQEEKLKGQVFDFIQNRLSSEGVRNQIFKFIDDKLSDEFAPNRPIKVIWNGKLMELLENNLNKILKRVIDLGMKWLQENKEKISEQIYEDAQAQSNFAWTYKNSIKSTILNLIEEGIPQFFEKEFQSLQNTIHDKVMDLGETPLNTTYLKALDADNLKTKVNEILQNPKLLRKTRQLTNLLLEERIFKIPLNSLIKDDAKGLLNHFKTVLSPEIALVQRHLADNLETEEQLNAVSEPMVGFLKNVLERNLWNLKANVLLQGIAQEDFEQLATTLVGKIFDASGFGLDKENLVNSIFETLDTLSLHQIIDIDLLRKDVSLALEKIFGNAGNQFLMKQFLQIFFQNIFKQLPDALDDKSTTFIIEQGITAIFKALNLHIADLIQSIDFKAIVVREIENMHAKQLESLFYGFARKYFTFLIGYGFIFGIIFGLLIDFGILWLVFLLSR